MSKLPLSLSHLSSLCLQQEKLCNRSWRGGFLSDLRRRVSGDGEDTRKKEKDRNSHGVQWKRERTSPLWLSLIHRRIFFPLSMSLLTLRIHKKEEEEAEAEGEKEEKEEEESCWLCQHDVNRRGR